MVWIYPILAWWVKETNTWRTQKRRRKRTRARKRRSQRIIEGSKRMDKETTWIPQTKTTATMSRISNQITVTWLILEFYRIHKDTDKNIDPLLTTSGPRKRTWSRAPTKKWWLERKLMTFQTTSTTSCGSRSAGTYSTFSTSMLTPEFSSRKSAKRAWVPNSSSFT